MMPTAFESLIIVGAAGVWLIIPIALIVIIVLLVRASKRKKHDGPKR